MRRILTLCLLSLLALGCEESLSPEWTIEISSSLNELAADGTGGGTNITIGVFDSANDDASAPQGEQVAIQCSNSSGDRTGVFAGYDDPGEAAALTDSVGLVEFRFSCSEDTGDDYDVNCFAIALGASAPLFPPLRCISSGTEE